MSKRMVCASVMMLFLLGRLDAKPADLPLDVGGKCKDSVPDVPASVPEPDAPAKNSEPDAQARVAHRPLALADNSPCECCPSVDALGPVLWALLAQTQTDGE